MGGTYIPDILLNKPWLCLLNEPLDLASCTDQAPSKLYTCICIYIIYIYISCGVLGPGGTSNGYCIMFYIVALYSPRSALLGDL